MYFAQPSFCVIKWCEFNFLKKYTKICVSFLIGNDGYFSLLNDGAKQNRLPWYLKIMYTPFIFAKIGVAKLHTFWLLLRNFQKFSDFFPRFFLIIFQNLFFSMTTLYICGNWCSKIAYLLVIAQVETCFLEFFSFFSQHPFICGNWCSKIAYLLVIAQVETVLKFEGNPQLRSIV